MARCGVLAPPRRRAGLGGFAMSTDSAPLSSSILPPALPAAYRVPAEWESQQAVSIATPCGEEFEPSQFVGRPTTTVESVHAAMVRGLVGHTKVRLLSQTRDEGASPGWLLSRKR